MSDDPYAEFQDDSIPSNLDSVLTQLADELVEAQDHLTECEREVEKATDVVREITDRRIPDATEGMNGALVLKDGRTLEIKEEIRSSIAGDKKIPAIIWLDENDYGHIVKRVVSVQFGKDCDELVKAFMEYCKKFEHKDLNGGLVVKTDFSVHHATLNSWVKEQLKDGVDLPRETFGIFRQRKAKVKD